MNTRNVVVSALAVVLAGGVYVSSAGATPGSTGDLAPVSTPPVVGTLDDSGRRMLRVAQDRVELKVKRESTVLTTHLTYPVGSFSGWHSHAGIVVAVVESGTVTRQSGCETETFGPGDAFYEVGPHNVSNPGAVPAVLSITRIFPTELGAARIDEEAPTCR